MSDVIRSPIVKRVAIKRTAILSNMSEYSGCLLCNGLECEGTRNSTLEVICVHKGQKYDWQELESQIWKLRDQKKFLRLIIEQDIPKEVLWAASYSEKNILQVNIDISQFKANFNWITRNVFLSSNCGLYVILFIYPIVPGVIKSYQVVEILNIFRNVIQFHTALKFSSNYEESNNPDFFIEENGRTVCNPDFIEEFMEIVNTYAVPKKMHITVCGETEDCTGLGGK